MGPKGQEPAPKGENQCRSKQSRCAIQLSGLSPQRRFCCLCRSRKPISRPVQPCLRRSTLQGCTIRSRGNPKFARGFMAPRQTHRGGVRGRIGTSSRLANRRGPPATRITTDRDPASLLTSRGTLTNKIATKASNYHQTQIIFWTLVRAERNGAPRPPMPIWSR